MSNLVSTVETSSNPVPKVLLQVKKEAAIQEKPRNQAWNNGPWDKGHWANRK